MIFLPRRTAKFENDHEGSFTYPILLSRIYTSDFRTRFRIKLAHFAKQIFFFITKRASLVRNRPSVNAPLCVSSLNLLAFAMDKLHEAVALPAFALGNIWSWSNKGSLA
jgi:hypothetical protein